MVCFSGNEYFRYVFDQLFKRQKKRIFFQSSNTFVKNHRMINEDDEMPEDLKNLVY